jgi:YVTN family beta-propeller protein
MVARNYTSPDRRSIGRRSGYRLGLIASAAIAFGLAAPLLAAPASAQPATSGLRIITNIPLGISATEVAVDPSTDVIYVTGGHTIAVVNGSTDKLVTKIHAGVKLADIAVDPATDKIYVTDSQSPNIFVISGKTNTVTATIPVSGSGSGGIAVDPSTDMVYASASPGMVAINGKTNTVVATISGVGGFVAADPATGTVYTNGATASELAVISEATNTVVSTIAIPPTGVRGLAVDPATDTVYASIGAALGDRPKGVLVIDGRTSTVTATTGLPGLPQGVADNPATNAVYVVNSWRFAVAKISGTTNKVVSTATLPGRSYGVAADPKTNIVYATDQTTQELTVLTG